MHMGLKNAILPLREGEGKSGPGFRTGSPCPGFDQDIRVTLGKAFPVSEPRSPGSATQD